MIKNTFIFPRTDSVKSEHILDGTIVDADISASAAIQATKISGSFTSIGILDTDSSHSLTLDWDENDVANRTLNFKVNSATRTVDLSGNLTVSSAATISGTNTGDQTITLTGDVTGTGTGTFAATVANDAITYAKMQNVSDTDKLLGRSTAGAGDVEEIACTAAGRAILDDADASAQRTTLGLGTMATQADTSVDINGGAVDGVTIGTASAVTDLRVDNIQIDGNTISSTNLNGDIHLHPNGTGSVHADGIVVGSSGIQTVNTGLQLLDTDASHYLTIAPGSNLTAARTLTLTTGDASRTVTLSGDTTLSGTNTGDQTITLTGDVTGSGTGSFAATIANDAVTYAKMQNVSATDKLLGRSTAGAGDVEEIACTAAARTVLDDATTGDMLTTLGAAAASHAHATSDITSGTLTHERGGLEADVSAYDGLIRIASGATTNLKSNFAGTVAPTANEDSGDGYVVGSRWIDTTNDKEYVCLDNTLTAAVWTETTASGSGIGGSTGSTDNAILRADGVGGATAQSSAVTIADTTGAITASAANSGAVTTHTFTNTSNDAGAGSAIVLTCGGTSASGDAKITYTVSASNSWSTGLDNSDNDKYKISASTALGTSDLVTISTTGNVTTLTSTNAGATKYLDVRNESNTASASTALTMFVGGTSAGDPYIHFDVNGSTVNWAIGVDNSDSDKFVISNSSTLGTSNALTIEDSTQKVSIPNPSIGRLDPQVGAFIIHDFNTNVNSSPVTSGTGSTTSVTDLFAGSNVLGVITLTTGTTTTGRAATSINNGNKVELAIAEGAMTVEGYVSLSALSDGTDTYLFKLGLLSTTSGTTDSDAIMFIYDSTTSANWRYSTRSASSETIASSSTAVSTAWTHLKIVVNAAGTSVEFFVDGVSVGTSATNIPTNIGLLLGVGIFKSAGTTSRNAYCDYIANYNTFTTARN